jgi:hypothetical protein
MKGIEKRRKQKGEKPQTISLQVVEEKSEK